MLVKLIFFFGGGVGVGVGGGGKLDARAEPM